MLRSTGSRTARRSAVIRSSLSMVLPPLFLMPSLIVRLPSTRRYRSALFDSFNLSSTFKASSGSSGDRDEAEEEEEVNAVQAFTSATQRGDAAALCTLYPRLASIQRTLQSKSNRPRRLVGYLELQSAYRVLLSSSDPRSPAATHKAARVALSLFEDAKPLWRCFLRPLDAHWALRAYISSHSTDHITVKQALRELLRLAKSVPESMQRAADWGLVLGLASEQADARGARIAVRLAKQRHVTLKRREKEAFFAALCRGGQVQRALAAALEREDSAVYVKPLQQQATRTLGVLLSELVRANVYEREEEFCFDQVQEIAQALHEALFQRISLEESRSAGAEWRALLEHASRSSSSSLVGSEAALSLAQEAIKQHRHVPDERTFDVLLRCHAAQLAALAEGTELDALSLFERIEEVLGVPAGRRAYAISIAALLALPSPSSCAPRDGENRQGNVEPGQIHEAMLLYARMRAKGILPNAPTLHPLIRAHTESFIPNLTAAFQLTADITRAGEAVDRGVYLQLLQGCILAREVGRAVSVIAWMRQDGLGMEQESRLGWTLRLISVARSHAEAHRVYEALRDLPTQHNGSASPVASTMNPSAAAAVAPFSPHGWNALLEAFRQLVVYPDEEAPEHQVTSYSSFRNMDLTLSLVRDMIAADQAPSLGAFTTLFDYYGKAARSPLLLNGSTSEVNEDARGGAGRRERLEALAEAIRALEEVVRSTPGLTPDLALITAIMDAYNRVGLVNRVLEIWRRLILVKAPLSSACIGVTLDACGWAHRSSDVEHVWKTANARHAQCLNLGVWSAYVEATARSGDVQRAVDTAFGDMRKQLGHDAFDARMAGMLLRFAARERDRDRKRYGTLWFDLCDRISEEAPLVWQQLKRQGVPGATALP